MESSPKTGCIIRSENDPYQFQCVFSTDPEDKREFSVYFRSPDGRQDIMASCTYDKGYECIFAREGLSLTEDFYISVSETFSEQNGSFVCRNGGAPLEQFPCFYSGNSVKHEVKGGMTDSGSNTLHNPGDFGTEDNNLAVIIDAACGVVIILQFIFIGFLLFKNRKLRKDRKELRLSTEKSEEARTEAELRSLIQRKSEEAKKVAELRRLIAREHALRRFYEEKYLLLLKDLSAMKSRSSNGEPGEAKYWSDNNSFMSDSSTSINTECTSGEKREASDEIKAPAGLW